MKSEKPSTAVEHTHAKDEDCNCASLLAKRPSISWRTGDKSSYERPHHVKGCPHATSASKSTSVYPNWWPNDAEEETTSESLSASQLPAAGKPTKQKQQKQHTMFSPRSDESDPLFAPSSSSHQQHSTSHNDFVNASLVPGAGDGFNSGIFSDSAINHNTPSTDAVVVSKKMVKDAKKWSAEAKLRKKKEAHAAVAARGNLAALVTPAKKQSYSLVGSKVADEIAAHKYSTAKKQKEKRQELHRVVSTPTSSSAATTGGAVRESTQSSKSKISAGSLDNIADRFLNDDMMRHFVGYRPPTATTQRSAFIQSARAKKQQQQTDEMHWSMPLDNDEHNSNPAPMWSIEASLPNMESSGRRIAGSPIMSLPRPTTEASKHASQLSGVVDSIRLFNSSDQPKQQAFTPSVSIYGAETAKKPAAYQPAVSQWTSIGVSNAVSASKEKTKKVDESGAWNFDNIISEFEDRYSTQTQIPSQLSDDTYRSRQRDNYEQQQQQQQQRGGDDFNDSYLQPETYPEDLMHHESLDQSAIAIPRAEEHSSRFSQQVEDETSFDEGEVMNMSTQQASEKSSLRDSVQAEALAILARSQHIKDILLKDARVGLHSGGPTPPHSPARAHTAPRQAVQALSVPIAAPIDQRIAAEAVSKVTSEPSIPPPERFSAYAAFTASKHQPREEENSSLFNSTSKAFGFSSTVGVAGSPVRIRTPKGSSSSSQPQISSSTTSSFNLQQYSSEQQEQRQEQAEVQSSLISSGGRATWMVPPSSPQQSKRPTARQILQTNEEKAAMASSPIIHTNVSGEHTDEVVQDTEQEHGHEEGEGESGRIASSFAVNKWRTNDAVSFFTSSARPPTAPVSSILSQPASSTSLQSDPSPARSNSPILARSPAEEGNMGRSTDRIDFSALARDLVASATGVTRVSSGESMDSSPIRSPTVQIKAVSSRSSVESFNASSSYYPTSAAIRDMLQTNEAVLALHRRVAASISASPIALKGDYRST